MDAHNKDPIGSFDLFEGVRTGGTSSPFLNEPPFQFVSNFYEKRPREHDHVNPRNAKSNALQIESPFDSRGIMSQPGDSGLLGLLEENHDVPSLDHHAVSSSMISQPASSHDPLYQLLPVNSNECSQVNSFEMPHPYHTHMRMPPNPRSGNLSFHSQGDSLDELFLPLAHQYDTQSQQQNNSNSSFFFNENPMFSFQTSPRHTLTQPTFRPGVVGEVTHTGGVSPAPGPTPTTKPTSTRGSAAVESRKKVKRLLQEISTLLHFDGQDARSIGTLVCVCIKYFENLPHTLKASRKTLSPNKAQWRREFQSQQDRQTVLYQINQIQSRFIIVDTTERIVRANLTFLSLYYGTRVAFVLRENRLKQKKTSKAEEDNFLHNALPSLSLSSLFVGCFEIPKKFIRRELYTRNNHLVSSLSCNSRFFNGDNQWVELRMIGTSLKNDDSRTQLCILTT